MKRDFMYKQIFLSFYYDVKVLFLGKIFDSNNLNFSRCMSYIVISCTIELIKSTIWNLIQEQFKFVTIKCKNMRVISTLVVSFCTHHITYDPFTFVSQFFSRWYSGHGDMAVSNAIGSNVFDILVCLGLPWFMSTAMVHPGSVVKVRSRGIVMIHIKFYIDFCAQKIQNLVIH